MHSNTNCTSSSFLFAFDNAADGSCVSNGDAANPVSWRFYCAGGSSTATEPQASPDPSSSSSGNSGGFDCSFDPCACYNPSSEWGNDDPFYVGGALTVVEGCYNQGANGQPSYMAACPYASNPNCNNGWCQQNGYRLAANRSRWRVV